MHLTRRSAILLLRLSGPLAGIGMFFLFIALFFVLGCVATLTFAVVEWGAWLFLLPGRLLQFFARPRLPRG